MDCTAVNVPWPALCPICGQVMVLTISKPADAITFDQARIWCYDHPHETIMPASKLRAFALEQVIAARHGRAVEV